MAIDVEKIVPKGITSGKINTVFFNGSPERKREEQNQRGCYWQAQLEYMNLVTIPEYSDVTEVELFPKDKRGESMIVTVQPIKFIDNGTEFVALLPLQNIAIDSYSIQIRRRADATAPIPTDPFRLS